MLRKAKQEDRNKWVRLNREFMDFEIQDDNLWGHIDTSKDEELAMFLTRLWKNQNI